MHFHVPLALQYFTWNFTPQVQDKLLMKPSLLVWGQGQSSQSSGGKKKEFVVRAIGEGAIGQIKVRSRSLIQGALDIHLKNKHILFIGLFINIFLHNI